MSEETKSNNLPVAVDDGDEQEVTSENKSELPEGTPVEDESESSESSLDTEESEPEVESETQSYQRTNGNEGEVGPESVPTSAEAIERDTVEENPYNPTVREVADSLRGETEVVDHKTVDEKGLVEVTVLYDTRDGYRYVVHEPELTPAEEKLRELIEIEVKEEIKYKNVTDELSLVGLNYNESEKLRREFYRDLAREKISVFRKPPWRTTIKNKVGLMDDEEYEDAHYTDEQVEAIIYYIQRDLAGYDKIDPLMNDAGLEEISCNGSDKPIYVNHDEYANSSIETNIVFERDHLDSFVQTLAQRSGKHISTAEPAVDAALPDGSRAQLTFTDEVSADGTHFTIRVFDEVPLTPVELIMYETFDLKTMAFLMLAAENEESLMVVGSTASGKTTTLKALGMFIPSTKKIVSIEDTRELILPTQHWIKSVTRDSFGSQGKGAIDEYKLIEASLRQRPEYILMGEVRGEEARDLFQALNSGHATWSTLHADETDSAIQRLGNDPMNVSRQLMKSLDLIIVQELTKVGGQQVRRFIEISEITGYSKRDAEITHHKVFDRDAEADEYFRNDVESEVINDIQRANGWSDEKVQAELSERKMVLKYLLDHDITEYHEVYPIIYDYVNAKNIDREDSDNRVLELIEAGELTAEYSSDDIDEEDLTIGDQSEEDGDSEQ